MGFSTAAGKAVQISEAAMAMGAARLAAGKSQDAAESVPDAAASADAPAAPAPSFGGFSTAADFENYYTCMLKGTPNPFYTTATTSD